MRCLSRPRLVHLLLTLCLSAAICTPSFADDITLVSIGPRMGFSGKTPLMGKEQKYPFHLFDVAAVVRLPWSWPLGESPWSVETRLITSAGVLTGASEKGQMVADTRQFFSISIVHHHLLDGAIQLIDSRLFSY